MLSTKVPLPRYNAFNIYDFTYKTVQGHPILLSVLIPKKLKPQKHSILVRFHGGGLVEGVRLGDWFRPYMLDHCAANSVIVVSPDYRLLPESTGWDMLEDVRDFWHWMAFELQKVVDDVHLGLEVDLTRIAVTGESAGGYLAAQSIAIPAILPPSISLRVALLQAPILDLDPLRVPAKGSMFDLPMYETTAPNDLRSSSGPGKILTYYEPDMGARMQAAISMFQHGTFVDVLHGHDADNHKQILQADDVFWPIRNLEKLHQKIGSAAPVPALWIVAGWHDCMVPPDGAVRFCTAYKRRFKSASVLLSICDGDHGFDGEWSYDAPEVEQGWAFVNKHWR